jgi:hypothetical protein
MNNLNLDNYGVQELNAVEMEKTDGGSWYRNVVKFLEFVGFVEVVEAFVEGFSEGVKEGYNEQQRK